MIVSVDIDIDIDMTSAVSHFTSSWFIPAFNNDSGTRLFSASCPDIHTLSWSSSVPGISAAPNFSNRCTFKGEEKLFEDYKENKV